MAIAGLAFVASLLLLTRGAPLPDGVRRPDALAYVLLAIYSAWVVVRRLAPELAVFGGLLTGIVYAGANYPVALLPLVLLSIYTAATALPPRRARVLLAGAILLGTLQTTMGPGATDFAMPALIVSAWLLGNYVATRRAYTAELEAKNRQLEEAQLELADQAVSDERLRLARELHDVIAHTLSVVALHAGSGRMVAEDNPAAARRALETIETATRSAVLEMRRMLGVLRGSDDDRTGALTPTPGLGDLDALVAEVVKSGVTVEVRVEGDRPDVPTGVDLSAYRIVQEGLTNVIKHAGRAKATVAVRYSDDAVTVEIDDEGPTLNGSVRIPSSGRHGLVGMRERVAMYNGEFAAGPRLDRGFKVRVRLPFGERV